LEFALLRQQLRAGLSKGVSSYFIVRPQWYQYLTRGTAYEEFGYPSTAFDTVIEPMAHLALAEAELEHNVAIRQGSEAPEGEVSQIIDMRELIHLR
jgi:hypothetical protein